MDDLTQVLRLVLEIVVAITALVAALEARKNGKAVKRFERELAVIPEKAAVAVVAKVNGAFTQATPVPTPSSLPPPAVPPPAVQPGPPS